jgi:hypothetical protein
VGPPRTGVTKGANTPGKRGFHGRLKCKSRTKESAANGGSEDPAILAIEKGGGTCFRAKIITNLLVKRDLYWVQEVDGNPVISVEITDCKDFKSLIPYLAQLPHLQSLGVYNTHITDENAHALAGLKKLRNFRSDDTRMTTAGIRALASFKQLRGLYLDSHNIDDDVLNALAVLLQLRYVDISHGAWITDSGLRHLASLNQLLPLTLPTSL